LKSKIKDRKKRLEIRTKPETALEFYLTEYSNSEVDYDAFGKVLGHLADHKNALIFLALKNRKEKQKKWLETSLGIWIE
jgi:hypothetical protein